MFMTILVNFLLVVGFLGSFNNFFTKNTRLTYTRANKYKWTYIGMKVVYFIACITFIVLIIWFNWMVI